MSFGLPSLKPENSVPDLGLKKSSDYGVHDTFKYGIRNVKSNVEVAHPLELSEKNYKMKEHQMQMSILRNGQGLHAPIKIGAEIWATKQTGRLPFLESANLSLATLTCADDSLDFTDFLSIPEVDEKIVVPHIVMEHKLGIL